MMQLKPSEIRYSQDSISMYFTDSDNGSILDLFEKLITGEMAVSSLRPIAVAQHDGNWMAFYGNRRLFVLKVRDTQRSRSTRLFSPIQAFTITLWQASSCWFHKSISNTTNAISVWVTRPASLRIECAQRYQLLLNAAQNVFDATNCRYDRDS